MIDESIGTEEEDQPKLGRGALQAAMVSNTATSKKVTRSGGGGGGGNTTTSGILSQNAVFLDTLTPELRREVLLTADEEFLQSLPPEIQIEAVEYRTTGKVVVPGGGGGTTSSKVAPAPAPFAPQWKQTSPPGY